MRFTKQQILPLLIILLASMLAASNLSAQSYTKWTEAERSLIFERDSSQVLRVFKITNPKDSVFLRQKCLPVVANEQDTVLLHFINRMFRTVRDSSSLGVGIAAPQVGLQRQIIWVQRFDKDGQPFEVYLNPKIIRYSAKTKLGPEGCLSIPDRREEVRRPCDIVIEYDQVNGKHRREKVKGFTAVIFQHEIDHLNGILYLDHLEQDRQTEN